MATSIFPLPIEVQQSLVMLGERISLQRRLRHLTQGELAERVGVGLSSIVALEKGHPGVASGTLARVLWGLNILPTIDQLAEVTSDDPTVTRLIAQVPKRVRT